MTATRGIITLSLDVELGWGAWDGRCGQTWSVDRSGIERAMRTTLDLLEAHHVHATWAFVGALFFHGPDDLRDFYGRHPSLDGAPLRHAQGLPPTRWPSYFALDLLEQVRRRPGQEIGLHSFAHFTCLDPGRTVEAFRLDTEAAIAAANAAGVQPTSYVFPRNQGSNECVACLSRLGIKAWRGNEGGWLYPAVDSRSNRHPLRRVLRLADAYVNLGGDRVHPLPQPEADGPVNVPASRFLRPVPRRLRFLEPMRRGRILRGVRRAAREGGLYHLWWHPHNGARDPERSAAFLRAILDEVSILREDHGLRSLNMAETAAYMREQKQEPCPAR